jgi:hypothetical protein
VVHRLRLHVAVYQLFDPSAAHVSTYLAVAARDQLDRAQRMVDEHLASDAGGRCLTCGRLEPCEARSTASAVFARYGRLPSRRPGLAWQGQR